MVRGNDVTFQFRIDSARAKAAIQELTQVLERLNATNVKVDRGLKSTQREITTTGNNAAASAVNFQTATQGLLNLSTAAVQTFTSVSNLDRAHNRARMSVIAVARAEDLLNSKKLRLNELTEKGITSGAKYANLTREIATAEADRTEKIEKMKIEQAAVNDIYMLFATNVANVVISSTQTIVVLLGQERAARLASAAATRIQSASLLKHFTITGLSIKQLTLMNLTTKIGIAMTQSWTASIKAATIAMAQFTRSNGVLIGITAAAVGLLAAYETNFLGLKDAIDGLLGTEAEHISLLEEQRNAAKALEESNNSMANSFEFRIPKSLSVATIELAKHRQEYERLIEKQKESAELAQKVSVPVPTGGPKTVAQLIQERDFRDARKGGTFFGIKLPEFLPQADAAEQNYMPAVALQGKDELELRRLAIDFLSEFVSSPQFREQIFRQQQTVSSLSKEYNTDPRLNQLIPDLGLDPASIEFQDKLAAQKAGLSLKEYQLRKVFTVVDTPGAEFTGRSLFRGQGMEALKGKIVNGVPIGNVLRGRLMVAQRRAAEAPFTQDPEEFADITDPEDELTQVQYARLLAAQKGVGGSMVLTGKERRIFEKIAKGEIKGKRAEVLIRTGEDIGAAANAMDIDSALLLGAIQESQRQFNRTSADPFISDFDKLSRAEQIKFLVAGRTGVDYGAARMTSTSRSDVARIIGSSTGLQGALEAQRRSVSGIRGIGGQANAAIAQAQARRQIEDNLKIAFPAERRRQLDIRDSNENLLRFGGTLRDGMSVWDEGAVIGGYSSRKEWSAAGRRKTFENWDRAREFADWFSGISRTLSGGKSNRRGQYTRMANSMHEIKGILSSAGLGYKRFNARTGLRYRYTMKEYNAYHRDWAATVAFNDNQLAKARQINLLQEGFGLGGFTGSALTLPSLQQEVARQDELMRTIGLDRTEAFQIVDTEGRGREEIDDRIRFKDRMNSMSTGVSVL